MYKKIRNYTVTFHGYFTLRNQKLVNENLNKNGNYRNTELSLLDNMYFKHGSLNEAYFVVKCIRTCH